MLRIQRKRLLTANLSVEMPPGAVMLKAGFTERSRRIRRRRVQD
jgi:hypothetical protein